MSANSRENKELLWQLLSDHPFQKENPRKFQSMLEYKVNEIHEKRFGFQNNLMEMNKEIIRHFTNQLNTPIKKQNNSNIQNNKLSKNQIFDSKLKEQKNNFETLMQKKKPQEIDFSDKTEESPITDRMVNNTLEQRKNDLKNIMEQYNTNDKSTEWLKGESTSTEKKISIHKSSALEIKPTIIETSEKKNEKRVHFNVSETPEKTNNLLNKLKKKQENNNFIEYFQKILSNQEKIITLLERNNN